MCCKLCFSAQSFNSLIHHKSFGVTAINLIDNLTAMFDFASLKHSGVITRIHSGKGKNVWPPNFLTFEKVHCVC